MSTTGNQVLSQTDLEQKSLTGTEEMKILRDSFQPVEETYTHLHNFDSKEQIKDILFRSYHPPLTPLLHLWSIESNGKQLMRLPGKNPVAVKFATFGLPDKRKEAEGKNRNISYSTLFDNTIHQTVTLTIKRKPKEQKPRRTMPDPKLFKVPGFPYDRRQPLGSPTAGAHHEAGHCHDIADKPPQKEENDKKDASNSRAQFNHVIIPETGESYWGNHIRRPLVAAIRKSGKGESSGGVYAQYPYYPEIPLRTLGGYCVPEGVYFTGHSFDASIAPYFLNIRWDYDFSQFLEKHPSTRPPRYKFVYTEFREDKDALPFPTLLDMQWDAKQISERVEIHREKGQVFLSQKLKNLTATPLEEYEYHLRFCSEPYFKNATLDPMRGYEHHTNFAATLEINSPRNKLDLAIHHAKKGEEHIAAEYLEAAFVHAKALWDCNMDELRYLVTDPQVKDIVKLWKNKRDDQVDFWVKAHNDLVDKTNTAIQDFLSPKP